MAIVLDYGDRRRYLQARGKAGPDKLGVPRSFARQRY
jgi:hypothetical protein